MKNILSVIVVALVLVAVVTGCGGMHHYDARLAAADSLMRDVPDSALALVQAVDTASLPREGDRAYRDLLLTQARYRCYITATSDSDINRALAYYRHHDSEREKLTRAYIYKGAVMEELGYPDSAMLYYKHAEATAAPDDYFNLGQINTRIGSLYRIYHAGSQTCFEKYQSALHYYELSGDRPMQLICLYNMTMYENVINKNSKNSYFDQSIQLAKELKDSSILYHCLELKCRYLLSKNTNLDTAQQIAFHCLSNFRSFIDNDLLLDIAGIYVKSGKTDSANYYLGFVNENMSIGDEAHIRVRKYELLSILAKIRGDNIGSLAFANENTRMTDSIMNNKIKHTIVSIDNSFNQQKVKHISKIISGLKWVVAIVAVAFLITVTIGLIAQHKRKKQVISILKELENTSINNHESLLERIDTQTSEIEHFVKNLVAFMQLGLRAESRLSTSKLAQEMKNTVINAANDAFWHELRNYLDKNHNNIITCIARNYNFSEKDLRFIELHCCGFNYLEISITMGYAPNYISTKRKNIAKKIGIEASSLQDYLNTMMNISK